MLNVSVIIPMARGQDGMEGEAEAPSLSPDPPQGEAALLGHAFNARIGGNQEPNKH